MHSTAKRTSPKEAPKVAKRRIERDILRKLNLITRIIRRFDDKERDNRVRQLVFGYWRRIP
jgi:hypothetical protein